MNLNMSLKQLTACPDCASTNIVVSAVRDQVICRDCGLIFEQFAVIDKPTEKPTRKSAKTKPKPQKTKKTKGKKTKKR